MHDRKDRRHHGDLWSLAFTLGLLFVFLELLKTHRSSLWSGGTPAAWWGAIIGLGLYTAVVGGIGEGLWALLRRRVPPGVGVPLSAIVAAAALWATLSAHREYAPTIDDALVAAALVGLAAGAMLLPLTGCMSLRAVSAAASSALMAGIAALAAAGHVFLLFPHRAALVTRISVAWAACTGVVALVAWAFPDRRLAAARKVGAPLALIALPLVAMGLVLGTGGGPGPGQGPNLVLIVLDTLRADHCSAYGGGDLTPSLDALAERGALFRRCYALGPWTPPSMTGMFASTYPPGLTPGASRDTWRDEVWRYSLRAEDEPLAEFLAAEGYNTCAMVANPMLRGMGGMLRGFTKRCFSHPMIQSHRGLFAGLPFLGDALAARAPFLVATRFHDTTADMTRYALAYLRRQKARPFYLWVHYMDPHAPYDPPDAYRTQTGPWRAFCPIIDQELGQRPVAEEKPLGDFPAGDRPYVRSLYEGEVRYVDAAVGRIMAELERLGLDENTYVCVTADHGEELWDHGGWGHGQTVYDELVHVPLIMAGPKLRPQEIDGPVSAIDIMPTLADLAGVPAPRSWLGTSLAPALRGKTGAPVSRPCFARGTSHRVQTEPLEMVVVDEHKLVHGAATGNVALYDLARDPKETTDLAAQQADLVDAPKALIENWRASYPSTLDTFFHGQPDSHNRDEMLQQLRAIGYL